jgi:hypothetical protein
LTGAAVGWTKGTVNATGAAYRVTRAQFFIDHPGKLKALEREVKNNYE